MPKTSHRGEPSDNPDTLIAYLAEALGRAEQQLADIHHHHRHHTHPCQWWQTPATVTISDHPHRTHTEENPMTAYAPGQTVFLTAVVDNAEGDPVTDAGTWTSDNGTITPDTTNPQLAELTGTTLGVANVVYTTANGITGTDPITISDTTPTSVAVTDSPNPTTV
jgi:hypothetical protein